MKQPLRRALGPLLALLMAVLGIVAMPAHAHPLAPALLELRQLDEQGRVAVLWRSSVSQVRAKIVAPQFPRDCRALSPPSIALEEAEALVQRWQLQCASSGLAGRPIAVQGLAAARIPVIVQWQPLSGPPLHSLLTADAPSLSLPVARATGRLAALQRYIALGARHLLGGLDHLLFILGLCWLIPHWRLRLAALSCFTAAHSVSLGLTASGYLPVPSAWAEVGIAASLIWLALELLPRRQPARSNAWQTRPLWMAFGFGLVHGLGFASALQEYGTDAAQLPLALLGFNLGIEAGQLLVVLIWAVLAALWRYSGLHLPARAPTFAAYILGAFSAQLFWARLLPLVPAVADVLRT